MSSISKPSFYFIKEIAIVVIGVLIAVSLSNYKEARDNKAYIEKTLGAIQQEVKGSLKDVIDVYSRHAAVTDSVFTHLDSDEALMDIILRAGGIQIAESKNIGLRFFISNKAELVDFDIISGLSAIENSNRLMEKKMDHLLNYAYDGMNETDRESKMKFLVYLNNVMDSEQSLMEQYDDLLVSIES